jgi:hypothetical protein
LRRLAALLDLTTLLGPLNRKANREEWSALATSIIDARWEVSKARSNLLRRLGYNARTWRDVTYEIHRLFDYDPRRHAQVHKSAERIGHLKE